MDGSMRMAGSTYEHHCCASVLPAAEPEHLVRWGRCRTSTICSYHWPNLQSVVHFVRPMFVAAENVIFKSLIQAVSREVEYGRTSCINYGYWSSKGTSVKMCSLHSWNSLKRNIWQYVMGMALTWLASLSSTTVSVSLMASKTALMPSPLM